MVYDFTFDFLEGMMFVMSSFLKNEEFLSELLN